MYGIKTNERNPLRIRQMKNRDLRMLKEVYYGLKESEKEKIREEWKKVLDNWVEDQSIFYFFTVLKADKVIGLIVTRALEDSPADMVAIIRLQKAYRDIRPKTEKLFIEMCRNFGIYDSMYIVPRKEKVTLEGIPDFPYQMLKPTLENVREFPKFEIVARREEG